MSATVSAHESEAKTESATAAAARPEVTEAEMEFYLTAQSPLMHFEKHAKIQNALTKRLETPRANVLQRRMAEAVEVLEALGVPAIRVIVTKTRQCGGTTFAVEILYHRAQRMNTDALILANIADNSRGILDRMKVFSAADTFPWGNALSAKQNVLTWANGSTATITSAEALNPGISKPRQAVLFSESAKYPRGGVKDDEKIFASILPSLNDAGIAIAESTPDGASGMHYKLWQKALSLDDFLVEWRKGNTAPGNGWVKVFAAWFEFAENQKLVSEGMRARIDATLTPREANGRQKYGWTHGQIAWRRAIMEAECGGSEDLFDEFYPEDDVGCFLSSGRPRFNVASLRRLEQRVHEHAPEVGSLVEMGQHVDFQPDGSGFGAFHIWERPRVGCSYIVWCDPATGEDQTEGRDPDRHSIGVLRAGYHEGSGAVRKDAVVARVRPPFTGTGSLTADCIRRLSEYYGGALVVLEINMGLHILKELQDAGVPLYKREVVDPYDRETQKYMYGWKLKDRDQRREVVDGLALAFHHDQVDLWCPHILGECRTFIYDKNGKETARSGCHDDDVLGLAMAWRCRGSATLYTQRTRRRRVPMDYRRGL